MTSTYEKAQDVLHQTQQAFTGKNEPGQEHKQTKSSIHQSSQTQNVTQRRLQMGCPQVGVIIAGFPSPLAHELTQHCVKNGINVSNIGLSSQGASEKELSISGVSKLEVLDANAPDVREHLEKARDALEKEGSEVVIILDVGQDWKSIDLYNRLKFPFVHSGSSSKGDEIKMYDETTTANNPCLIAPFISFESASFQLMFEAFARMHTGLFRGWSLDASSSLGDHNTIMAAERRMEQALSYLVDSDPSSFSQLASGKGTLSSSDDKNLKPQSRYEQQQGQQQQQQGQMQGREQQQEHGKEQQQESSSGGGGLMAKLGLTSAAHKAKEAAASVAPTSVVACHSGFTLRSPDGKDSFSMSHEHQGLACVESIVCMADFLADKILKGREPRVWGIKDWVASEPDMNRQIVERLEGKEQDSSQRYRASRGQRGRRGQEEKYGQHEDPSVLGAKYEKIPVGGEGSQNSQQQLRGQHHGYQQEFQQGALGAAQEYQQQEQHGKQQEYRTVQDPSSLTYAKQREQQQQQDTPSLSQSSKQQQQPSSFGMDAPSMEGSSAGGGRGQQ